MPISKAQRKELQKLGKHIKSLREKKQLTQKALALACDKDQQSIQRLERGDINPGYLYLLQISEGLETDITELLKGLSE